MQEQLTNQVVKRPSGFILGVYFFTISFFSLILYSCATFSDVPQNENVIQCEKYVAYRLNLSNPEITVESYPEDVEKDSPYDAWNIKSFSKEKKCFLALNATPFCVPKRKTVGIHKVAGKVISSPVNRYAALLIRKTRTALEVKLVPNQVEDEIEEYDYAFGGFFMVLEDGKKKSFDVESFDTRTAVGYSSMENCLYFLFGKDISYQDSADIFLKLGCRDAMQFDGGSSSQFCIDGNCSKLNFFTRKPGNMLGFSSAGK